MMVSLHKMMFCRIKYLVSLTMMMVSNYKIIFDSIEYLENIHKSFFRLLNYLYPSTKILLCLNLFFGEIAHIWMDEYHSVEDRMIP